MVTQLPFRDIHQPPTDRQPAPRIDAHHLAATPQRSWLSRNPALMVALGVVVFVGMVTAATLGGKSASDARTGDRPALTIAGSAAGIGTAIRDGDLQFTVTAVDAGVPDIGTAPRVETAEGQFIAVHLTVENIGTTRRTFDPNWQTMTDQQGEKSTSDVQADLLVNPVGFLSGVDPGGSVSGMVVFDMAKDAVPAQLELHDAALSGGISLDLLQ